MITKTEDTCAIYMKICHMYIEGQIPKGQKVSTDGAQMKQLVD